MHENIKPFKCDNCNKDFGTKGGLIRHNEETHKDKNRIRCHLCKNTYSRKEYLGIHMKVVHSTWHNKLLEKNDKTLFVILFNVLS